MLQVCRSCLASPVGKVAVRYYDFHHFWLSEPCQWYQDPGEGSHLLGHKPRQDHWEEGVRGRARRSLSNVHPQFEDIPPCWTSSSFIRSQFENPWKWNRNKHPVNSPVSFINIVTHAPLNSASKKSGESLAEGPFTHILVQLSGQWKFITTTRSATNLWPCSFQYKSNLVLSQSFNVSPGLVAMGLPSGETHVATLMQSPWLSLPL